MPLDGRDRPRLVLVAAPAGFGKTTALSQWLTTVAALDWRVAWLSLDDGDSEVTRFLTHVVAAVQRVIPEVGLDARALLEAGSSHSVETVLVSVINDLDALVGPTVIALDDYHAIDDPAVHEAMTFFIDNLPPQVVLAMTTRSDPPLPLARLRARDELVELRADDLRFTAEESTDFLNGVMDLDLAPSLVDALSTRTEGWAAGLQLAALSARTHLGAGSDDVAAFVDAFSGSNRFVLDYLVEEVLDRQPDTVRAFLLDTSVVDALTADLADVLTGRSDGQSMLETLERDNVFVVPLDDERRWYRYHHLFADALRARLQSRLDDGGAELHHRASTWLAEHGLLADAIRHSIAGGDPERTADLVELGIADLRRRRANRTLRAWLDAVPDDVARRRPLIATNVAWAHLTDGDVEGVERWLQVAEAGRATASPLAAASGPLATLVREREAEIRSLPAMIAIYRASVAQARGDVQGTVTHASAASSLAGPDDHFLRGAAAGFLGLAAWAAGDLVAAVDRFSEAVSSLGAAGMVADELGGTVVLAAMWTARGRPVEAGRLCEGALAVAATRSGAPLATTGDLHVALAQVRCEHGDLDAAAAHLEVARDLGEPGSLMENQHRWYAAMAALLRARHDFEGAVEMLDRAEPLFLPGFFPDLQPIAATRARVHIAQGRLDEAWSWARAREVSPTDDATYAVEYEQLTLARLLVASGDPATALRIVDAVLADAVTATREGSVIEARIVRALAHHALGDSGSARSDLSAALTSGVPAGFARLFLDEGDPMAELLAAAAAAGPAEVRNLAERLLAGARETQLPRAEGHRAPEGLSEREAEVLRLLATDLSGPEIAGALYISVNTLRTHTKRIYTKLGVNTRLAAVRRAAALGVR